MAEVKKNSKQKNKLVDNSVKILLNKKAVNLVEYDLRKINNAVADYFIICSGTSKTHIQSLA
ncbi:MAG TPA: ribosome silencing factor, partial [Bacteroidetes bacterium]|nr:ribosome silencing factor [Bacteroidota bacterium]